MRLRWYAARSNGEAQGQRQTRASGLSMMILAFPPFTHVDGGRDDRPWRLAVVDCARWAPAWRVKKGLSRIAGGWELEYEREEPCVSLVASEGGPCLTI